VAREWLTKCGKRKTYLTYLCPTILFTMSTLTKKKVGLEGIMRNVFPIGMSKNLEKMTTGTLCFWKLTVWGRVCWSGQITREIPTECRCTELKQHPLPLLSASEWPGCISMYHFHLHMSQTGSNRHKTTIVHTNCLYTHHRRFLA
jgi:hypothetical protein